MKTFITKVQGAISLSMEEMQVISKTYEVEYTKEYLYENYPDWSDEKVDWVARDAREIMEGEDSSAEVEAIGEALENYAAWCKDNLAYELSQLSQDFDFYEFSDVFESEAAAVKHIREMLETEEGIESLLKFCSDILSTEDEQVKPNVKKLQRYLQRLLRGEL